MNIEIMKAMLLGSDVPSDYAISGQLALSAVRKRIELVKRGEQRYAYRIVAQQEARKHTVLRGDLYAEVKGRQGEEIVTYPLASLADDLDNNSIKLRFRYFQAVEGELVLPEGFEPDSISVVARSSTPSKAEIREDYPWRTNERFTHVGK